MTQAQPTTNVQSRPAIIWRNMGLAGAVMLMPLLAFLGLAVFSVGESNLAERAYSERLTKVFLNRQMINIGKTTADYAWWDLLTENVVTKLSTDWVNDYIGLYAHETFNFDRGFVVSADDALRLSIKEGEIQTSQSKTVLEALAQITDRARAGPMDRSVPVQGYLMLDGEVHMVAGAPITIEEPTTEQLVPHPRPVLFFTMHIGDAYLKTLAGELGIFGLTFENDPKNGNKASVPLMAVDDSVVATLS